MLSGSSVSRHHAAYTRAVADLRSGETQHDMVDALQRALDALTIGKLGEYRMVDKMEFVQAVKGARTNRVDTQGGVWSQAEASAVGDVLQEMQRQLAKPARIVPSIAVEMSTPTTASSKVPVAAPAPALPAASLVRISQHAASARNHKQRGTVASLAGGTVTCPACQHVNRHAAVRCTMCDHMLPKGNHSIAAGLHSLRLAGQRSQRRITAARRRARMHPGGATRLFRVGRDAGKACKGPMAFVCVFFLVWYGALIYGTSMVISAAVIESASEDWTKDTCLIQTKNVRDSCSDDGCTYYFEATVQYNVNGNTYQSNACKFASCAHADSKSSAEAFAAGFTVGTQAPCWLDPADPQDNVKLSEEVAPTWVMFVILPFLSIFYLAPCCMLRMMLKRG